MKPDAPLIFKKIIEVMRSIEAIDKSRKNQQQGWQFRGVDDVYNELHHHLAEIGVFTVPEVLEDRTEERTTKSGAALIYRILKIKFTFYAEDGSSVAAVVIGEGMDSGDKASNKAMSIAHKYAFLQVFVIATKDTKDPDNESLANEGLLPKGDKKCSAPPSNKIFDKSNDTHRDYLITAAKKLGILDIGVLNQIVTKLHGKDFSEFPYIATECCVAAKGALHGVL